MTINTVANTRAHIDALNHEAQSIIITDAARAKAISDEAIALAASLEPPYWLGYARALSFQIEWHFLEAQYAQVIHYGVEAQSLYAEFAPDRWLCRALYFLGVAYHNIGQFALALECHHRQFAAAQAIDFPDSMASASRRIGVLHKLQNQPDLALRYYEQSLAAYQRAAMPDGLASVYNNMALVYLHQGAIDQALAAADHALELFGSVNHSGGQIATHATLVEIYLAALQPEKATFHADAALNLARQATRLDRIIKALVAKADVLMQADDCQSCLACLTEAIALAEQSQNRADLVDCLRLMSKAHRKLGNFEQALAYHEQYHDLQAEIAKAASNMRFEQLEVLYRTHQAQAEAEALRHLREEDRRYYEQLSQMKDDLLSTASHDLKNPLASMKMTLYLLRAYLDTPTPPVTKCLTTLDKNIEQMQYLVVDILDLARLQTGAAFFTSQHDIINLVQQVAAEFESQVATKGLALAVEATHPTLVLKFDAKRIHQVLNNLLSNALKYTPSGSITIEISATAQTVVVRVRDTGLGIPAHDLPYVFERFYRVDDPRHAEIEGTGLGLAICQSIIEQHQGRIWAESVVGQGSVFSFELPLQAEVGV